MSKEERLEPGNYGVVKLPEMTAWESDTPLAKWLRANITDTEIWQAEQLGKVTAELKELKEQLDYLREKELEVRFNKDGTVSLWCMDYYEVIPGNKYSRISPSIYNAKSLAEAIAEIEKRIQEELQDWQLFGE